MDALAHLAIVWCSVYLATFLAAKTRLTPVLYFLALGAVMVNTGILPSETDPFIRGFADIGIIIIMFALGFEENPSDFIKSVKRSWGIAFFGGVAPFAVTYAVADYFWNNTAISIVCGLTMTSTAISLTMVSLKSEGLQKSLAAKGIITSAVLEDIASLALIAILIPIATGQAEATVTDVVITVAKAGLFFAIVTVLGMCVFPDRAPSWLRHIPLLGSYGISHFLAFDKGRHATLTVLLLALLVGLLAHYFGFHPAIGAYMAGLIIKKEYFALSKSNTAEHYYNTKKIIDNVAFSWIGPVFFVTLGTKILFDWDLFISVIPETVVLLLGVMIVQVASSYFAALYTGGFNKADSLLIGLGMLGRAELAFVVMDIAYVQHQIMTTEVFYTLMCTAFWLNVAVPITINLWKRRVW